MSEIECDFCGRRAGKVRAMVAGPDAHICDECVTLCGDAVETYDAFLGGRQRGIRADGTSHCSFCGKHEHEAILLIAGQGKFICDACVNEALTDLASRD